MYSFSAGGEPADIYSMRVGNPEFRAHGLPGAKLLAVSSSGEMAVALGWHWGGSNVGAGTLARVSLAGGAPRQLLENAMDADWAPDGKSLAVLRYVGPGRRIEFPLGKVLYETKNFPFIAEPRVSPRGDAVAFLELDRPNGVFSVQIVDRAGKRRKLSDGWSNAQGLAWSRTGEQIWFAATKSGFARALYAVTLSGKERLVTRFPGGLTLHDIAKNGRVLLTQESTRREMVGRLSGDASDRYLTWLDYSGPADLSADGKRFLFVEAGEGSGARPSLWLGGAGGSAPVRLGEGSNASSLSPDGKRVAALRTRSDGPNELVLVPTGAGEERRVALQGPNPLGAKWLPDGERLLIEGQEPGGKIRCYVIGLAGGAPRPITPEGTSFEAMTPDGKWVLCSAKGQAVLYPVENGEPRPLPRPPNPEVLEYLGTLAWADDDHTVFVAESGVPARILRLDIHTWQKTLWKEVAPADIAGVRMVQPVLITPDGRSYVYTFRRVLSDLYLAEGLR
jgi:Tol biopolymer transport system component